MELDVLDRFAKYARDKGNECDSAGLSGANSETSKSSKE